MGRMAVVAAVVGITASLLVACTATSVKNPSASAPVAESSQTQSKPGGAGGSSGGAQKAIKSSDGGNVTIDVTWENPKGAGDQLTFSVQMNTHSVNLDGYDLGRLATLRNDQGQDVKAERWESASGGHHRSGILSFPAKDGSGNPILGGKVRAVEMVIRDVAGVKERVLHWEIS